MKTRFKQLRVVALLALVSPLLAVAIIKGKDYGYIMFDDIMFDYRF